MEFKEAINFLNSDNNKYQGEDLIKLPDYQKKYNEKIKDMIGLLQEGEVYRQMIEKMKKDKYDVWVSLPGGFTNLPDFIRDIEKEVTVK